MQNVNNRKTMCRGEKEHTGTLYFLYNLPKPKTALKSKVL